MSTSENAENIAVRINGETKDVPAGLDVASMLEHLGVRRVTAVVEHNGRVLDRSLFTQTPVRPGDTFEIVHFVGGGC